MIIFGFISGPARWHALWPNLSFVCSRILITFGNSEAIISRGQRSNYVEIAIVRQKIFCTPTFHDHAPVSTFFLFLSCIYKDSKFLGFFVCFAEPVLTSLWAILAEHTFNIQRQLSTYTIFLPRPVRKE